MHLPVIFYKGNKPKGKYRKENSMNDEEFMGLMEEIGDYLKSEKVFIKNPARFADVNAAREIANELFQESNVTVEDDPLQTGSMCLCVNCFDVVVRGKREIKLFQQLISNADNFEIYASTDDHIKIAIMFNDVLVKAPEGKPIAEQ